MNWVGWMLFGDTRLQQLHLTAAGPIPKRE